MKEEIKFCSDAVGKQSAPATAPFTQQSLKKAVKSVMEEDARSQNVMVFGLSEKPDKNLGVKIADILMELGHW